MWCWYCVTEGNGRNEGTVPFIQSGVPRVACREEGSDWLNLELLRSDWSTYTLLWLVNIYSPLIGWISSPLHTMTPPDPLLSLYGKFHVLSRVSAGRWRVRMTSLLRGTVVTGVDIHGFRGVLRVRFRMFSDSFFLLAGRKALIGWISSSFALIGQHILFRFVLFALNPLNLTSVTGRKPFPKRHSGWIRVLWRRCRGWLHGRFSLSQGVALYKQMRILRIMETITEKGKGEQSSKTHENGCHTNG